jgi:hypothetical protein
MVIEFIQQREKESKRVGRGHRGPSFALMKSFICLVLHYMKCRFFCCTNSTSTVLQGYILRFTHELLCNFMGMSYSLLVLE